MYPTLAVILSLFILAVNSHPVAVNEGIYKHCKDYPDKVFKITGVKIPGCNAPPCKFKRGDVGNVTITFTTDSTSDVTAAYVDMCGNIGIACANLDLTGNNICDLGAKCPIKNGDINTINISVPISKSDPPIEITAFVYFELNNGDTDRKDSIGCFEVEIQLI